MSNLLPIQVLEQHAIGWMFTAVHVSGEPRGDKVHYTVMLSGTPVSGGVSEVEVVEALHDLTDFEPLEQGWEFKVKQPIVLKLKFSFTGEPNQMNGIGADALALAAGAKFKQ